MEDYTEKLNKLSKNLSKSEKVNSLDNKNDRESSTLAHAFLDITESTSLITKELIPKLMSNKISESQIDDILLDIGEEFRHILYHIKDPKYYSYLFENNDAD
ncbi:MAG: hypothetical protein GKR88_16915 [Flavobacteriaceae bacterium]|nr:MAG: hypothetical protein GKR88_16915 [Flavobacteriaceae bacterium]